MNGKEIAKFFAGFAANQLLTHGALAAAGIQFSLLGITYDQQLNTIAVVGDHSCAAHLLRLG